MDPEPINISLTRLVILPILYDKSSRGNKSLEKLFTLKSPKTIKSCVLIVPPLTCIFSSGVIVLIPILFSEVSITIVLLRSGIN